MGQADAGLKRGLETEDQFWGRLEKLLGRGIPVASRDIWLPWSELRSDPLMIAYAHELKAAGHPVGILTNTHPAAYRVVAENGGYDGLTVVASSESTSHAAKPDAALYRELLERLGVADPRRALLVDDQDKSLRGAQALGIATIKADPTSARYPSDLRAAIDDVLGRSSQPGTRGGGRSHGYGFPAASFGATEGPRGRNPSLHQVRRPGGTDASRVAPSGRR